MENLHMKRKSASAAQLMLLILCVADVSYLVGEFHYLKALGIQQRHMGKQVFDNKKEMGGIKKT